MPKSALKYTVLAAIVLGAAIYGYVANISVGIGQGPEGEARSFILAMENPLREYQKDIGHYPTTQQGLRALLVQPAGASNWHGPYILGGDIPKDRWGMYYQYASPGLHHPDGYDLWSLGASKGADPKTVIGNWTGRQN